MVFCLACGDPEPEPYIRPSQQLADYIRAIGEESSLEYNEEEFTQLVKLVTTEGNINAEVNVGSFWTTLLGLLIHARLKRARYWDNQIYEDMAQALLDGGADMYATDEHGHSFLEHLRYLPRMALLFGSKGLKKHAVLLAREFEQSRIWLFKKQYKGWEALERVKDETIEQMRAELEGYRDKLVALDEDHASLTRTLRESEVALEDVALSEKRLRRDSVSLISDHELKVNELKEKYAKELNDVTTKAAIQSQELATYIAKSKQTQMLLDATQNSLILLQQENSRLKAQYAAKEGEDALRVPAPAIVSIADQPRRPSAPSLIDGINLQDVRLEPMMHRVTSTRLESSQVLDQAKEVGILDLPGSRTLSPIASSLPGSRTLSPTGETSSDINVVDPQHGLAQIERLQQVLAASAANVGPVETSPLPAAAPPPLATIERQTTDVHAVDPTEDQ